MHKSPEKIINFLTNEFGLSKSSIDLAIRLSLKNKSSLPLALWSYNLINNEELDKFYDLVDFHYS